MAPLTANTYSVSRVQKKKRVSSDEKKPQTGVGAREEEEREGAEFKASEDLRELAALSSSRGMTSSFGGVDGEDREDREIPQPQAQFRETERVW